MTPAFSTACSVFLFNVYARGEFQAYTGDGNTKILALNDALQKDNICPENSSVTLKPFFKTHEGSKKYYCPAGEKAIEAVSNSGSYWDNYKHEGR